MVFDLKLKNSILAKKRISSDRPSQEEQNGSNFSFIAPSSEELCVRELFMLDRITRVPLY